MSLYMRTFKRTLRELSRIPAVMTLVVAWSVQGRALAADKPVPPPLAGITASFKIDPRLTRSLYMGDRWVSPATFNSLSTDTGKSITVHARAQGFDGVGRRWKVNPQWIASDPEMVTVSPARGAQVEITMRHPGTSTVTLMAGKVTKELRLNGVQQGATWRVDIMQTVTVPPAAPARARKARPSSWKVDARPALERGHASLR